MKTQTPGQRAQARACTRARARKQPRDTQVATCFRAPDRVEWTPTPTTGDTDHGHR